MPKAKIDTGPSEGIGKRLLNKAFTPLSDAPSRLARGINKTIDTSPTENPWLARLKGFGMGALEGAGNVASDMTSPVGIASMAIPEFGPYIRRVPKLASEAKSAISGVNVTPQFNTAEEAISHYMNRSMPRRGAPGDVPNNPAAQALEAERKAIERNYRGKKRDASR